MTFSWSTGSGAVKYWLDVGNTPYTAEFTTGETTATSRTVSGLPCDGRTIYASLYTFSNGGGNTFLVYPGTVGPAGEPVAPEPVFALADLVAGGRQVRLGLGSIPFGFRGPAHREQVVAAWEKVLRDAA